MTKVNLDHDNYMVRVFAENYKKRLSIKRTAKFMKLTFHKARGLYHAAIEQGLIKKPEHAKRGSGSNPTNEERKQPEAPPVAGRLRARATPEMEVGGKTRRFLLTTAQNNTLMHEPLWDNIQALAKHYDARILVARSVYNRFARASEMDKKLIVGSPAADQREYTWDKRLEPYFSDERLQLAPGLVWCGETNILPTSPNPLAGFESYTGRASAIVPHPRVAMRSVASHPSEGTKFLYTTGTLTQRNYIQRKAGQMAEFHHCYGALLVEVDKDGTWFCRQIIGDSEGVLHDLTLRVADGRVAKGNSIEAITWGDIHVAYGDPVAQKLAWGKGGLLDTLRPKYQFMHDLIDFRARNLHNIKYNNHLQAFVEYTKGHTSVEEEMAATELFLYKAYRPETQTVVVDSNHDNFFVEWINKSGNFRKDPENAVYFLQAALYLWEETQAYKEKPNMTLWAMQKAANKTGRYTKRVEFGPSCGMIFLQEKDSFIICPDAGGGIECGLHGHRGPNGARGTASNYARMGRKSNRGHEHSASIVDGAYTAGLMGLMDQGYNVGPGSWSQSNILTYPNGKRAIQTIYDGKAYA